MANEFTNRLIYRHKTGPFGMEELVEGEAEVEGFNSAVIKMTDRHSMKSWFHMVIDMSRYRLYLKRILFSSAKLSPLNTRVSLSGLPNPVVFNVMNMSPSPWNSGFGQAYYLGSTIDKIKDKTDRMKYEIATGVTESFMANSVETWTRETLDQLKPMLDWFKSGEFKVLDPENEFYID